MTSGEPITVLSVDDDPDLVALLERGLEREDDRLTVRTATSARAARETLREADVDCVLSDYYMPETTGLELLRRVRADDPDLPFILYTQTGDEAVASEAISADVTDYVIRETIGDQHALLATKIVGHVERRRAEKRAERTDERLQELAEASNDVLFTFSADWTEVLFVNSAYEDTFGQSTAALRADPSSFLDRVHEDDRDRVELAMRRVSAGHAQQVEYRVVHPTSVQLWVESQCSPITDDDGTVQRITGFTREITDRKIHERELAAKNEQLEQFTSTVAHDLRSPLNVADGYLAAAREECDSDHLEPAADAVGRMDDLLEELLALAQAGETIGERTTVDLTDVAAAAANNVVMSQATLEIEGDARIECDPARLKEAFENLYRNAVVHNDQPVTITAGPLPDRSGVYVEDDGRGLDDTDRTAVFESGHSTSERGTGYGLTIVEQIVEAHGWEITPAVADSGGARFDIVGMDLG